MIQIFKAGAIYQFRRVTASGDQEVLPLPESLRSTWETLEAALMAERTSGQKALDIIVSKATDAEKLTVVDLYPEYRAGTAYVIGNEFRFGKDLYRVLQAHTAQADWIPSSTPALYLKVALPGAVAPWVQPTGAHDAYAKGARVVFGGKTYESLIDANTWSPSVYPQGWKALP